MKKKFYSGLFDIGKRSKKFVLIMKCFLFLLLVFNISVSAKSFSQNARFDISLEDASLVKVINTIEKKLNIGFVYDYHLVRGVEGIDVNLKNTTVKKVLEKVLKNTGLKFLFEENIVIISKADKKKASKSDKKTITGKVTDKKGNPLPGVSVVVKGTNSGVATDKNGKFTIVAKKGDYLVFSFIGMKNKSIKIGDGKEIKVTMLEETSKLEEVIVTGFSNIKKETFTGNAVVVDKKKLKTINPKNVISALQVFDPSFRIKVNNNWGSDPNSMPIPMLRGESSIGMEKGINVEMMKQGQRVNLKNNPNLPIFMINGFEVDVQRVYDMDMNRIQNITILKDAAATALYGSRAANGVILIRTVTPSAGKVQVSYNLTTSITSPDLSDYNLCDAAEKLEVERLAGIYDPATRYDIIGNQITYNEILKEIQRGVDSDWLAQPLQDVFNHKHSLYIEGGSKHLRYGLDFVYDKNEGVMKGSYRDRKGVSLVLDYYYKNLKIRNKFSYDNVSSENSPYGSFYEYTRVMPYRRIYDEEGEIIPAYGNVGQETNPLHKLRLENFYNRALNETFTDNLDIEYEFLPGCKWKNQFNISKNVSKDKSYLDPEDNYFHWDDQDEKGKLTKRYSDRFDYNLKSLLTFNKSFQNHFINIVGGVELIHNKSTSNNIEYFGFNVPNLISPTLANKQKEKTRYFEDESNLVGFLSSINYSYKNTYLLDASFRYDGSSKFGKDKKYAPFWSVGLGLNIHKYEFMKAYEFINRLKIRASYGKLGKINFPPYTAITSYEFYRDKWSLTGPGTKINYLGNPELKWETTTTTDLGFDLGLFNGRINLKASYYIKTTEDMISELYLRQSSGFEKYKINSGEIENKGYEINLNTILYRTQDMILTAYGNIGGNKNEITKLSKAMERYNKEINDAFMSNNGVEGAYSDYKTLISKPIQQYYVGASTSAIYAVKSDGIDPSNGLERFRRKDGTVTYSWYANDQVVVGDLLPDAQGSFGFNFNYKGFFVNTSFYYEFGGQVYNQTIIDKIENIDLEHNNVDKRVLTQRWKNIGDMTPFLAIDSKRITRPTSRLVQDNNFIHFNSLSFGYDFDKKFLEKFDLSKCSLTFNMNDIKKWSTVKTERGIYYPYSRTYMLTLNLSL